MTQDTSALFQPLTIRKTTFKNRFCVGPLTIPTVFGSFGEFSPDGLDYFEARARGGFGLIFTGAMHPDALVDPVHPLDHKRPMKAPGAFKRSAVDGILPAASAPRRSPTTTTPPGWPPP